MYTQQQILENKFSEASTGNDNKKLIQSRFGNVAVNLEKTIFFPSGLLGMPDKQYFCLADFPKKEEIQFKVLQSLDDINLTFMVLPLPVSNALIDGSDIEDICNILGTTIDNITIILIASVHNTPNGKNISVNVRAPLIINLEEQAAAQYVFPSNKYKIRHMLSELNGK